MSLLIFLLLSVRRLLGHFLDYLWLNTEDLGRFLSEQLDRRPWQQPTTEDDSLGSH